MRAEVILLIENFFDSCTHNKFRYVGINLYITDGGWGEVIYMYKYLKHKYLTPSKFKFYAD